PPQIFCRKERPLKSLKLPALRAVVADTAPKERRVFPLLLVIPCSISLLSAPKGQIWPFSAWGGAGPSSVQSSGTQSLTAGHTGLSLVLSQAFLRLLPLLLFLQLVHLLLVITVQRHLD